MSIVDTANMPIEAKRVNTDPVTKETMTQNISEKFSGAIHYTSAAATASSAIDSATSTASSAIGFGVGIASAIVNAGLNTVSSATRFATDTTYNVTMYAVNTTKGVVLSSANVAKPYIPEAISSRTEKLVEIAQEAYVAPMETAQHHLPQPVYDTLAWSVNTTVETAQGTKKRIDATKDYTMSTIQATREMIHDTKEKLVHDATERVHWSIEFGKTNATWAWNVACALVGRK